MIPFAQTHQTTKDFLKDPPTVFSLRSMSTQNAPRPFAAQQRDLFPLSAYAALCRGESDLAGREGLDFAHLLRSKTHSDLGACYATTKTEFIDAAIAEFVGASSAQASGAAGHQQAAPLMPGGPTTVGVGRESIPTTVNVVLFGAGMDSRSIKFLPRRDESSPTAMTFFEVDTPSTLRTKHERLRERLARRGETDELGATAGPQQDHRRRRIEIPVESPSQWVAELRRCESFDKTNRTVFVLQDVSMFLTRNENLALLDEISDLAGEIALARRGLVHPALSAQMIRSGSSPPADNMMVGDVMHGFFATERGREVPAFAKTLDLLAERCGVRGLWGPDRIRGDFARRLKVQRWRERALFPLPMLHRKAQLQKWRSAAGGGGIRPKGVGGQQRGGPLFGFDITNAASSFVGGIPAGTYNMGGGTGAMRYSGVGVPGVAPGGKADGPQHPGGGGTIAGSDLLSIGRFLVCDYLLGNLWAKVSGNEPKFDGAITQYVYRFEK